MARKARGEAATAEVKTRRRLTPDQKAEIAQRLQRGEAGNAIAEQMGVSAATVYAQRRKSMPHDPSSAPPESALRMKLVSYAVRSLLKQSITDAEMSDLESAVREELVRRVAAGL